MTVPNMRSARHVRRTGDGREAYRSRMLEMNVGRKRLRVRLGPGASRLTNEVYCGVSGVVDLRESLLASYGLRMRTFGCEGGWFGGGMLVVSGRMEWDLG